MLHPREMSTEVCASCQEPLVIDVALDSDFEDHTAHNLPAESVPDDVELGCGCHYHWECFLDSYSATTCEACSKDTYTASSNGQQQVLCTVRNEGGIQENFDILPSFTEEAYLRTYPAERVGHAFLEFCREGDIDAIIHLIKDADLNDAEEQDEKIDILRYQGSFERTEGSGLHVAIRYSQHNVAWLLLALASPLSWQKFPAQILQAMTDMNLSKEERNAEPDIRSLKDSEGRNAADLAKEINGWTEWIGSGWLLSD